MCDKWFNNQIASFPTHKDYLDFDFILTMKLGNEKTLRYVRFIKTSEVQIDIGDYKDLGYIVYECVVCGQLWALHDPDDPDRGYFKRIAQQQIEADVRMVKIKKRYSWLLWPLFAALLLLILIALRK